MLEVGDWVYNTGNPTWRGKVLEILDSSRCRVLFLTTAGWYQPAYYLISNLALMQPDEHLLYEFALRELKQ